MKPVRVLTHWCHSNQMNLLVILKVTYFYFMYVWLLCMNLWFYTTHTCVSWVHKIQKLSDHLELQLQTHVSHRVGAGNLTQVLGKKSQCF